MDCYSAESEFIESLDFLSPPVKRISSTRQPFVNSYNTDANDVHLLRGVRNKFAGLAAGSTKISIPRAVKNSESSTSLVLKKTSEGQILGQKYSIVSFPSLHQPEKDISTLLQSEKRPYTSEKPLIKVTVIPKTDKVQAAKLLRKRRYIPKRVQSTTSNHENFIQTKNVYLIVAGRRREKIYEIKTTGSAKLSTDHNSYTKNEEIPITQLANFKHLIQSLNMESKKKKEKKAPAAADTSDVKQRTREDWKKNPKCIFLNEPKEVPKKSCLRIFGQFGISEDDKYVLRYGATVDDKKVMSNIAQLTRDFSPVIAETSYGPTEEQSTLQQDSCLQANYNYDLDIEKPPVKEVVSTESQGTQVNFDIQIGASKERYATVSDKKVQCSCCGNRSQHNTLKDCQSPMVIISVYPKSSPEDLMKSVLYSAVNARSTSPAGLGTNTNYQVLKTEKPSNKSDIRRNYKSPQMSRSPSPVKQVSRSKVPDDPLKHPVSEKNRPDRQKALRSIKEKIREKDKLKQDASSRKLPLKLNMTNATQVSKNFKNLTVSNATQVSKRNQVTVSHATQMSNKNYQVPNISNGTQLSAKKRKINTVSDGTQYYNEVESVTTSNATQCEDTLDSLLNIAPIKHSINEALTSQKYPQHKSPPGKHPRTQLSQTTQVPKFKQFHSNHATQLSKSDPLTISCATQVSKNNTNVITPRMARTHQTFIAKPVQGFKKEQTTRLISKTKTESGTNTNHAQAKKALVDTYTKKLTEQMNQRQYIPAGFDNSKVTINIDGDKEYYDVLFNRDKMSTDLTIRKTLKDMGSQKCIDEPSLRSLLRLPDCVLERGGFESGIKSPTRSPSIALYNPSEDELPLMKNVSRLTIRDSLEICHRREENKSNSNIKNTGAQPTNIDPNESEFLAPIKHFTGDDCSIIDPIERDKQIRELLGVDKVKPKRSITNQGRSYENDDGIPYQCIRQRQTCKESQVTKINYEFQKLCPCFKPRPSLIKDKASVSIQVKNAKTRLHKTSKEEDLRVVDYTVGKLIDENKSAIYQQLILNRNIQVFLQLEQFSKQKPIILSRKQYDKVKKTIQKTISMKKSSHGKRKPLTNCESSEISIGEVRPKKAKDAAVESSQQNVNRDAAVQPRQQRVKDAAVQSHQRRYKDTESPQPTYEEFIKDTESPQPKYKEPKTPRKRAKELHSPSTKTSQETTQEKAAQTVPCNITNCTNLAHNKNRTSKASIDTTGDNPSDQFFDPDEAKSKKTNKNLAHKESRTSKASIDTTDDNPSDQRFDPDEGKSKKTKKNKKKQDTKQKTKHLSKIDTERDLVEGEGKLEGVKRVSISSDDSRCVCQDNEEQNKTEVETYVLFNAGHTRENLKHAEEAEHFYHTRKTMSSVEIRYESGAFMKQVAYSSTDVAGLSDSSIGHLNSFHTLFRGHRKCATPNLGTSAYSLYSEDVHNSENKCVKLEPQDSKPKKPFLRRLMSCLVMRSTRNSVIKLPIGPPPDLPSVNSSIDSYHISTSLGAVEVSSSMYDTSASFYSNHTILPVNSKIKRGFFSSVRGFLTNLKS